ncbi:hypothetical protein [Streptomyces sp. col6]|uniref:hypothetical protein n=1 Tax=Streptomyces sp. col6 TaxID=2478958 RepID=UPI0011CD6A9F|nr:hypothetical protein [Streptomyces sp. col6]
MENGQDFADPPDVDEAAGQVVAVLAVMLLKDGDGFLGAPGVGEQPGDVLRRVSRSARASSPPRRRRCRRRVTAGIEVAQRIVVRPKPEFGRLTELVKLSHRGEM